MSWRVPKRASQIVSKLQYADVDDHLTLIMQYCKHWQA